MNRCNYCNDIVLPYEEYDYVDGICIQCLNEMLFYEIIQ